jgi:hypothetical protein
VQTRREITKSHVVIRLGKAPLPKDTNVIEKMQWIVQKNTLSRQAKAVYRTWANLPSCAYPGGTTTCMICPGLALRGNWTLKAFGICATSEGWYIFGGFSKLLAEFAAPQLWQKLASSLFCTCTPRRN